MFWEHTITIPLWLLIAAITLSVLVVTGLVFWVRWQGRWLRIRAIVLLAAGSFAIPSITIVAKAYGVDVSIGETSWPTALVAVVGIVCLYHLERLVHEGEASEQLLHEFKEVLEDFKHGVSVEQTAEKLGVSKSRVNSIYHCLHETIRQFSDHEDE